VIAMARILLMAAVVLVGYVAEADQLQFRIAIEGGNSYASFAKVRLLDAQDQQVFRGYTDRYGRTAVSIRPGRYRAIVVTSGRTRAKMIELTGASRLRLVTLE
jgi:hypothetical protein